MSARVLLSTLIVAATAAFVVGTAVERSTESDHHDAASEAPASGEAAGASETHSEAGAESAVARTREAGTTSSETSGEEAHAELRPLGVNIERWSFVALAALVSLALACAAWLRPQLALLLALVAVTMLAFTALDIREVFHQLDVSEDGLAVLAAAIACLHGGGAVAAAVMAARARRRPGGTPAPAGTMPM